MVSSSSKVVGIGWAKTGTTTLGKCLHILGFTHCSTRLDLIDDLQEGDVSKALCIAEHFDSFDDWPWTLLYEQLDQTFPGSKFIMTLRDDATWIRSYRNMVSRQSYSKQLSQRRSFIYGMDVLTATDLELVERKRRHEDLVRRYFLSRPNDLLEVDWEKGDRWGVLCRFLGYPEPRVSFPHENIGFYGP